MIARPDPFPSRRSDNPYAHREEGTQAWVYSRASLLHLPGQVAYRAQVTPAHDWGEHRTVHLPDIRLARGRVAPQHVGLAIAVKIPHTLDLPGQIAHRARQAAPRDGPAVHQPHMRLA